VAIYIVTGKLGGGKTLAAVSKINSAISDGRRVATNLDLSLLALPAVTRSTRQVDVQRVPDRPTADHIRSIGFGIRGVHSLSEARQAYQENKFGILVLDECGTWLNSREWQEEGRRDLINFLLHIRKHLWDVYLIIQDVSMLDKQARKALAEHVVYCRRMDRIAIPFLGTVVGWFTGDRVKLPKFHLAIVKYGDQPQSITVDKWWFRGNDLYDAYDTTQVFLDDYPHGLYSVLPPWYQYRRSLTEWDWKKYMRLTHVYLRQYSRTMLATAGVLLGAALAAAFSPDPAPPEPQPVEAMDITSVQEFVGSSAADAHELAEPKLIDMLRFDSFYSGVGQTEEVFLTNGVKKFDTFTLGAMGYRLSKTGNCRWRLDSPDGSKLIRCTD